MISSAVIMFILYVISTFFGSSTTMPVMKDFNICTKTFSLFWNFSWSYFKDESYATFVAISDGTLSYGIQLFECGMKTYNLPFHFYLKHGTFLYKYTPPDRGLRPKTNGYVITSNSVQYLEVRMEMLTTMDPDVKTVFVLINGTTDDANYLLKIGWSKYNLLNFVVFRTAGKPNHLAEDASDLEVSVYNPFDLAGEERGLIHNFKLEIGVIEKVLSIIRGRLKNLHKYPLRVCVFEHKVNMKPQMYKNGSVIKYTAVQGEVIHHMTRSMNFKPEYFAPPDGERYGGLTEDGNLTGSLKEVDEGRADILANLRLIKDDGQKHSLFIYPIQEIVFVFLTPKMGYASKISFLQLLNRSTSICFVLLYVGIISTWGYLQYLHGNFKGYDREISLPSLAHRIFGMALLVSQTPPVLYFERWIFISVTFFSMISCYTYQAKMVQNLMSSHVSMDLNTMEDLAKTDFKILVSTIFENVLRDVAEAEGSSGIYSKLYSMQEISNDTRKKLRRVQIDKNVAALINLKDGIYYSATYYRNDTGQDVFHVLPEGPPNRAIAHMVPHNSVFKNSFSMVMMHILESGLVGQWLRNDNDEINRLRLKRIRNVPEVMDDIYTMQELSFIFWAWCGFCLCCSIVFLVEIFVFYYFNRL